MKSLFALFILISFTSMAKDEEDLKLLNPFYVYNTKVDTTFSLQKAQFVLHFHNENFAVKPSKVARKIELSINGVLETIVLDSSRTYTITVNPGVYRFKLWAGFGYSEIFSDSIRILPQHIADIAVNFHNEYQEIMVDKPVIYAYSPKPTDFFLHVQPKGQMQFTYPELGNGWTGTTQIDGSVHISGKNYPYFFWEAKENISFVPNSEKLGYRVAQHDIIRFLEQKATEIGLTANETTDLITYWGPKMNQYNSVFVRFELNESCNQFGQLTCSPAPDNINRVYLLFSKWDDSFAPFTTQKALPAFHRSGFQLLEWGGAEIIFQQPSFLTSN